MLETSARAMFEGHCTVNDEKIASFIAIINVDRPDHINFTTRYIDEAACKEHRTELRKDEAAFKDYVYAAQDVILVYKK